MPDTIEFGKQLTHWPILVSFILSFFVGGFGLIINIKLALMLFFIVLFLLIFIYFPSYLPILFGHWQLENHGISYYKMNSYRDKLKMIFAPNKVEFQFISYSQIKSVRVVTQDQKYSITDILTIKPDKQSVFPWLRKPFFLELELNKNTVNLDLSFDQVHDPHNTLFRISNALDILGKRI